MPGREYSANLNSPREKCWLNEFTASASSLLPSIINCFETMGAVTTSIPTEATGALCQDLVPSCRRSTTVTIWIAVPKGLAVSFSISSKLCCLIKQPNHPRKRLILLVGVVGDRRRTIHNPGALNRLGKSTPTCSVYLPPPDGG